MRTLEYRIKITGILIGTLISNECYDKFQIIRCVGISIPWSCYQFISRKNNVFKV